MTPLQALAAQAAPACPSDGRLLEFSPPPSRNTREWGCPVCGLAARAEATPEDGYLLWTVARRGELATPIMIPIAEPPEPGAAPVTGGAGAGDTPVTARFDGRPGLALNPGWPPGRKCWP